MFMDSRGIKCALKLNWKRNKLRRLGHEKQCVWIQEVLQCSPKKVLPFLLIGVYLFGLLVVLLLLGFFSLARICCPCNIYGLITPKKFGSEYLFLYKPDYPKHKSVSY